MARINVIRCDGPCERIVPEDEITVLLLHFVGSVVRGRIRMELCDNCVVEALPADLAMKPLRGEKSVLDPRQWTPADEVVQPPAGEASGESPYDRTYLGLVTPSGKEHSLNPDGQPGQPGQPVVPG